MGAILGGKPKVDPSIAENQRKQRAKLDKREAEADAKLKSTRRARGARSGARSLLANAEVGTRGLASTLGGGGAVA